MRRILATVVLIGLVGCSGDIDGGVQSGLLESPDVVREEPAPQPPNTQPPPPETSPFGWLVGTWDVFFVANQASPRDEIWDSTIYFRANGTVEVPGDRVLFAAGSRTVTFTYIRSNVTLPGLCDVTLTIDGNRIEGVYKIRGGQSRDAFALKSQ